MGPSASMVGRRLIQDWLGCLVAATDQHDLLLAAAETGMDFRYGVLLAHIEKVEMLVVGKRVIDEADSG